ncbi:glycosyltransferase [Sinosporangium siamense]|uniref:Glycosyl transferase n=1 Tax=Sinosporangium siamense TaxID=1367973 RepID=A0A919RLT7_9ACTN|nr:glycosyltransferase [Sinosporangium siamense]GII94496.1 glycosyl transferase [Sinosporangium siamense]
MRIALISEHASPLAAVGGVDAGGQNIHVAALAAALAERGHEVVVYTRRTSEVEPHNVPMAPGATVRHITAGPPEAVPKDDLLPHMADFATELGRHWSRWTPDVAHAHFWMSGVATLAASQKVDVPVAQTFHALATVKRRWQGDADTSPPERMALEEHVGRHAGAIIATCSDEVRELSVMGVPQDRVVVVPCGVDLSSFQPRGECAWKGERPRILSLGRMVPRKGLDTLIHALRDVPEAELMIVGGEPCDEEYVRLAALTAVHGVSDRVRFVGSVPHNEVPKLLRSADVLVTVPWYEPFGIVPVEAMACGVPVVASAVGGHLDTVAGCGLLIPPRQPELVARALNDLLADAHLRARLGAAGVRRARARYGWPRVAERTEHAYKALLATSADQLAAAEG